MKTTPSHAAAKGIERAAKTSMSPSTERLRALSAERQKKPYTAMAWNRTGQYLSSAVTRTTRKTA